MSVSDKDVIDPETIPFPEAVLEDEGGTSTADVAGNGPAAGDGDDPSSWEANWDNTSSKVLPLDWEPFGATDPLPWDKAVLSEENREFKMSLTAFFTN
jgi:hypothetical protein